MSDEDLPGVGAEGRGSIVCEVARERVLDLLLAGEREVLVLADHLGRCEGCRTAASETESVLAVLARDPAPEPSPGLEAAVLRGVSRRRLAGTLARAAALLVAGGLAGGFVARGPWSRTSGGQVDGRAGEVVASQADGGGRAGAARIGTGGAGPSAGSAEQPSTRNATSHAVGSETAPGTAERGDAPARADAQANSASPSPLPAPGPASESGPLPNPAEAAGTELVVGAREVRDIDLSRLAEVARLALAGLASVDATSAAAIRDEAVRLAGLYQAPQEQPLRRLLLETAATFASGSAADSRALYEALGRVRVTLVVSQAAAEALGARPVVRGPL